MKRPPHRQQGFILAVVLWSLAALTLIAGGITTTINHTLEEAHRLREMARAERTVLATEQTLLYLLSARHWNAAGLSLGAPPEAREPADPLSPPPAPEREPTLRFDGSLYPGVGGAGFALQDAGALFSLREPERERWRRLLDLLGVDAARADRWLDQLNDYQDRDDIPGLNGAEAPRYRELGLPPPRNRFMSSPYELRNLPFALSYPEQAEELIGLTTTGNGTLSNLNTAPAPMLRLLQGLNARETARVLARRRHWLLNSREQTAGVTGVLPRGGLFDSVWVPSGYVRIMLTDGDGRQKRWIAVEFTPDADGRPWLIEYNHPVDLHRQPEEPDTADAAQPRFPDKESLSATDWSDYPAFFPRELSSDR